MENLVGYVGVIYVRSIGKRFTGNAEEIRYGDLKYEDKEVGKKIRKEVEG